jgi:membrane-bound PQQ-dependent dehydrogenase (glucose/quinate/shikimate family)
MAEATEAAKDRAQPKRWLLAIVLAIIALALIGGGVRLLMLGGSPYYLGAGALVAASAWFALRGDDRAIWIYLAMLAATLLWALWEIGLDPWGLQVRLLAPAVLGVWVAAPWLRKLGAPVLIVAAVVILGGTAGWIWNSTLDDSVAEAAQPGPNGPGEWRNYGNDAGGSRFSPLTQINASNVAGLKPAWTFHTGVHIGLGLEATPLMVGGTVYTCAANDFIFALDAETGQQRWKFDPHAKIPQHGACRGVAYYETGAKQGPCAQRILFGTGDTRLMAIDALNGLPCQDFGDRGMVDLKKDMGPLIPGYYYMSSAPLIIHGKVVVDALVIDGMFVHEPSGVIRAFDATTGKLAWAWDMDHPEWHSQAPPPGQIYSPGTANAWGTLSGDETLGMVYVPLGSATPDYWGAHRSPAAEKYENSVVALDADTGLPRWNFQLVHHDVWDYDVSAQPTLIDLRIGGRTVPALIQTNKRGQVFLLDRRDGTPLSRVEERNVPQGAAKGDWLSPTQPFSPDLPGFDNTVLTEKLMWGATPLDQLWCRIKFKEARYEGPMTPPGEKYTINYPGYIGGVNWGGVSIDPERQLLTVNYGRVPIMVRLVPRAEVPDLQISKDGSVGIGKPVPQMGTPYAAETFAFMSPLFIPCTSPPFGKLAVVDLATRKLKWDRPLGSSRDSGPKAMRTLVPLPMGVPNVGGSLTTRGGLIFIGATQEAAFRAFDSATGKQLWHARLPAGGQASPMTYISPKSGRQFVVISAGGSHTIMSPMGDAIVAYALPKK